MQGGSFGMIDRIQCVFAEQMVLLQIVNEQRTFVELDRDSLLHVGNTGTPFIMLQPGLNEEPNTVSFSLKERPGWFVTAYGYYLEIQPAVNPRQISSFNDDATFKIHTSLDGAFSLESYSESGSFVYLNDSSILRKLRLGGTGKDALQLKQKTQIKRVKRDLVLKHLYRKYCSESVLAPREICQIPRVN